MAFGLPLAPFIQVRVVPELLVETKREWREVGAGLAFASRQYPKALGFRFDGRAHHPPAL
jgi:hypothetical protein